ncbi:MAG: hypothetical protein AAFR62_06600 [Cyanobacteria bacterium J06629_2]
MLKDVSDFPIIKQQCRTCPFRTDSRGKYRDPVLVANIQQRCLTESSQICHHPALSDKEQTHLCRGARDYQLEIFYRIGMLEKPTNECWVKTQL